MPAAPNHIQFAHDCIGRRTAAGLAEIPAAFIGAVLAGTQGSDPFYVYGRIPWRPRERAEEVHAFADFIHGGEPADVFPPLAARLAAAPASEKAVLSAYLYGFLLHYVLDRTIHPYVYYRTGFDAQGLPIGIYSMDHMRFEVALASAFVARRPGGLDEVWRSPAADGAVLDAADALFSGAFPDRVEPGRFRSAWKDYGTVRRLTRDPHGLKGTALDFFGVKSLFRAMMRPDHRPLGDKIDYANDSHAIWLRPGDGRPSAASVMELWEEAVKDAGRLAAFLERAAENGADRREWEAAFGDLDHEGRHPGEAMRYFRSVYRPSDRRLP